jgi:hypothetical protein
MTSYWNTRLSALLRTAANLLAGEELSAELRHRADLLTESVNRQTGGEDMGIEHGCDCGSCKVLRFIGEQPFMN